MIRTIVPDNMKAIVKTPDALSPILVTAFLDYVQDRGIFVDPARIRSPQDKPRVENQVPYVRESWFDGETFAGWATRVKAPRPGAATSPARACMAPRAPCRVSCSSPTEKPAMLPAPSEPFDVPLWVEEGQVHPDHRIQVARALCSVPSIIATRSCARADKASVKIYAGTDLIVHPRQRRRPLDRPERLPLGQGRLRPSQRRRAASFVLATRAPTSASTPSNCSSGPLPWARMRAAYALLRLCDKYSDGRVEAVCQSALAFDVVDVARITRMLKAAAKPAAPTSRDSEIVQLPLPRFAQPEEHFETRAPS